MFIFIVHIIIGSRGMFVSVDFFMLTLFLCSVQMILHFYEKVLFSWLPFSVCSVQ